MPPTEIAAVAKGLGEVFDVEIVGGPGGVFVIECRPKRHRVGYNLLRPHEAGSGPNAIPSPTRTLRGSDQ